MIYDVFISYSRRQPDREHAEWLDTSLKNEKISLWRDIREIDPFADFTAEIEEGIENSRLVAVCITPDIKRPNSFVRREIQYALALKKPVLPLRFTDTVPPISIINNEWIDFLTDKNSGLNRLLEIVRGIVPAPAPNQAPSTDPYYDYLTQLYQEIVGILSQTIIKLVDVRGKATPDAVQGMPQRKQLLGSFRARYGMKPEAPETKIASFHDGFEQYQGRILLLGEPGAGKSTTLLAYTRDAIVARLDDITKPLPILQRISLWDSGNKTPMSDWLAQSTDIPQDNMEKMLSQGQCLLLLDALDELGREREENTSPPNPLSKHDNTNPLPTSPEHRGGVKIKYDPRKRFIEIIPPNNQVVISCRIEDYNELGEKLPLNGAVTLQPLLDEQIEAYLHELPDLWNVIYADADLLNIARTPLLLSLIAFAFRDRPEDLQQAHDLTEFKLRHFIFESYVHERYEFEKNRSDDPLPFTLDEVKEVLGHVAMINASGGRRRRRRDSSFRNIFIIDNVLEISDFAEQLSREKIASFIDFALLLDLLDQTSGGILRFIHLKLRDYFAYEYSLPRLYVAKFYTKNYAPSPAQALGEVADEIGIAALISLLKDKVNAPHEMRESTARGLGKTQSEQALAALITVLTDKFDDSSGFFGGVRGTVAFALGKLGGEQALATLITVLTDKSEIVHVRSDVAIVLGKTQSEQALAVLITVLTDKSDAVNVRNGAAVGLGNIGGEQALAALLPILADKSDDSSGFFGGVRGKVANALGKIGGEQALTALITVLNDKSDAVNVRREAVTALNKIGGKQVLTTLITVLLDKFDDDYVRSDVAFALGNIGGEQALAALITVLNDKSDDVYVRGRVAFALGNIGGEQVLAALIAVFTDKSDYVDVRESSIDVLNEIGGEQALTAFIAVFTDKSDAANIRGKAANGLGNIGGEQALTALITILNDKSDNSSGFWGGVRGEAVDGLGKIGGKQALTALITILNDKSDAANVRGRVADGLGKIGGKQALTALIAVFTDKSDAANVRGRVADGLGKIGGEQALTALIAVFTDKSDAANVRRNATTVLSEIGGERAVQALINALSDTTKTHQPFKKNERICDVAAETLKKIGTPEALEAVRQWREAEAAKQDKDDDS